MSRPFQKKQKFFYRFVICTNIISKHLKCVYKASRHSVKGSIYLKGYNIDNLLKNSDFQNKDRIFNLGLKHFTSKSKIGVYKLEFICKNITY